jgi:hypothetical protein
MALVATVTSTGLCVNYNELYVRFGSKKFDNLLRVLTIVNSPAYGIKQKITSYRIVKNEIYFPWIMSTLLLKAHAIDVVVGLNFSIRRLNSDSCVVKSLYNYQAALVDVLCNNHLNLDKMQNYQARAYLKLDTGLGKTRIGCAIVARLQVPTIVVVPTKHIRNQWMEEFAITCPNMKCSIYTNLWKNQEPTPDNTDVVIIIINTAYSKPASFFTKYGLTIYDEAHELYSPERSKVLWNIQTPYILGLSATPLERKDNMDKLIPMHLGRPLDAVQLIKGEASRQLCNINWLGHVQEVHYAGHPDYLTVVTLPNGCMHAISTIGNIIQDPSRLRMIAIEVKKIYFLHETESWNVPGKRHGIFVFAEHRNYISQIRDAIVEHFQKIGRLGEIALSVPELESNISILRGGVTLKELEMANKNLIVLTTYGYSRRGVSLVDMTSIIMATPRRNGMRQLLGRITRRGSDERIIRYVVDIVDIDTPFISQSKDRRKIYNEKNWIVHQVNVNHSDFK